MSTQHELSATERRAQIKFLLKTLALVIIVVPLLDAASSVYGHIFLTIIAPILLVVFFGLQAVLSERSVLDTLRDYFTFIPVHYSEGDWWGERRLRATHVLILTNVAIHYALIALGEPRREAIIEALCFIPGNPRAWNTLVSPLTSMFLHADAGHLWWNMVFLWVFGLVLERHIGWRRFAHLYILTGVIAGVVSAAIHVIFLQEFVHGLGASGAIAGIMGVFAVRLYYRRLVFPVPILGFISLIFPLYLKIRLNSLLAVTVFFVNDVDRGIATLIGPPSKIAHWAHVGGLAAGVVLALRLRFQDRATEDMYTEKALAAIEKESGLAEAEQALRRVLELNPEREAALLALARKRSRPLASEEGRSLYQKLIRSQLETVPGRAADIFAEYFLIYRLPLDPAAQYRLALELQRSGRLELASRTLEAIADDPDASGRWAELGLFKLGRISEELRLPEAALFRYEQLLERFPEFPQRSIVLYRIKKLTK